MFILGLISRFWKPIAAIILVLGIIAAVYWSIASYGERRYLAGVEATKAAVREQIAAQNVKNREKEAILVQDVEDMDRKYRDEKDARDRLSDELEARIRDNLSKTPFLNEYQCTIGEDVLRDRNAIRALGPDLGE